MTKERVNLLIHGTEASAQPVAAPETTQQTEAIEREFEPLPVETFDPPVAEDQDGNGDEMHDDFDPLDNGDEGLSKKLLQKIGHEINKHSFSFANRSRG